MGGPPKSNPSHIFKHVCTALRSDTRPSRKTRRVASNEGRTLWKPFEAASVLRYPIACGVFPSEAAPRDETHAGVAAPELENLESRNRVRMAGGP